MDLGPLFVPELRRLTRGRWLVSLRTAFGVGLLLALIGLYAGFRGRHGGESWQWFSELELPSLAEQATFAGSVVKGLLLAQLVTLLLVTPVVVGVQLNIERQRRLLELIRTTGVGDGALLLGKLAARMVCLGSLLLLGVPILMGVQVYGGVEMAALLAVYVATAAMASAVAAASMSVSLYARTPSEALGKSLMVTAFFALPGAVVVFSVDWGWWATTTLAAMVSLTSVGVIVAVLIQLRGEVRAGRLAYWLADSEPAPRVRTWSPPASRSVDSRIGDRPLWWLEMRSGRRWFPGGHRWPGSVELGEGLAGLLVLGCCLSWGMVWVLLYSAWAAPMLAGLAGSAAVVVAGLGAAVSVARERDRQTLETLLCVPIDHRDILGAKWVASMWRAGLPVLLATALIVIARQDVSAILAWLLTVTQVVLAASVGLWLSVRCRSATRAQLWFVGLAVAWWAGCGVLAGVWREPFVTGWLAAQVPLVQVPAILRGVGAGSMFAEGVAGLLAGVLVQGVLAAQCWWAAVRGLRVDG